MSESDVCKRQILTYKDIPRAERINCKILMYASSCSTSQVYIIVYGNLQTIT